MPRNRIKTEQEISAMKDGGRMLALVLKLMREKTVPGLTPRQMSDMAKKELLALGGEPAFLGFYGYPDIICISVNNQVQHSIPSNTPFSLGDVINYDFGVKYKGMITDAGISVYVGDYDDASREVKRLLEGTEKALDDALKIVRNGVRVGDISSNIERTLRKYKLGIVKELVGHGVGHELHEDPEIPNYGQPGKGFVLKTGMTIAIEPITTLGSPDILEAQDGWTLLTRDGSWSAQFEHTVLVTNSGCEILTRV